MEDMCIWMSKQSTYSWTIMAFAISVTFDEPITTSSITLCWEDARSQPAHPKYDYFMFLLMIMIECLEDRRTYTNIFYEGESRFASIAKIVEATKSRIELESTPPALAELLQGVLSKLIEFGVVQ